MREKSTVALILAAGMGTRLGKGPKAFQRLQGVTLLDRLLDTVRPLVDHVIVGFPPGHEAAVAEHMADGITCYPGGGSRQETIGRLLEKGSQDIILIMDAARPFTSAALTEKVIHAAIEHGAALAYTPPPIPALILQENWLVRALDRRSYCLPQSPQAYHQALLKKIYAYIKRHNLEMQTTYEVAFQMGLKVKPVLGEEHNIKITTPLDWEMAKEIAKNPC